MGEVTHLRKLSISIFPLETSASTQKVLADEASPKNPPRSSQSHLHPQTSETAYPVSQTTARPVCVLPVSTGISSWKFGRKTKRGQTHFSP
jgi:hypothetical protein